VYSYGDIVGHLLRPRVLVAETDHEIIGVEDLALLQECGTDHARDGELARVLGRDRLRDVEPLFVPSAHARVHDVLLAVLELVQVADVDASHDWHDALVDHEAEQTRSHNLVKAAHLERLSGGGGGGRGIESS